MTNLPKISVSRRGNALVPVLVVIFLVVLAVILLFSQGKKLLGPLSSPTPGEGTGQPSSTTPKGGRSLSTSPQKGPSQPVTTTPPVVSFASYDNKASLPTVPGSINGYTLKTGYRLEEAKALGQKLNLTQVQVPDDRFVILYNLNDMDSRGTLAFDKVTGGISFQSWGVHKPKDSSGSSPTVIAQQFLGDLGLSDSTISCPFTYQRKGLTGVTFVECHRDWSKVGLPILNAVGLLNIPENQALSTLAVGRTHDYSPSDPSVFSVSTGGDNGKARPNDFSTITVAVAPGNRILSLESNMRKITETKPYSSSDLYTSQEALDQFINHKSVFSLTLPAGVGSINWTKVYPANQATSQKATITDYLLTFLEKPPSVSQDRLVPMYLIRGTAQLSSGYTARFVQVVPALKSGLSFITPVQGTVAGVSTSVLAATNAPSSGGLQVGTFVQPQLETSQCFPHSKFDSLYEDKKLQIPDLGEMTVRQTLGNIHTFYFRSASFSIKSMNDVRNAFFKVVEQDYVTYVARYIKDKPTTPLNSIDDAKRLLIEVFIEFKGFENMTKKQFDDMVASSRDMVAKGIAPEPFRKFGSFCPGCDVVRMWQIYNNVSLQILDNAKGNKLATLADKPINLARTDLWGITVNPGEGIIDTDYDYLNDRDCYISGSSPSLYLYPNKETKVKVGVNSLVVYSYPSLSNNSWSIVAKPGGNLTLDNGDYRRLYYEYDKSKVSFTEPDEGFVIKKDNWESFVRDILSPGFRLADQETNDLISDIRNELFTNPKNNLPYLKISLVNTQELNKKLPLTITPKPTTLIRIHLLLVPQSSFVSLSEPTILPITRTGFTAVELGVASR